MKEFEQATHNLQEMTLAMAETLVGKRKIRPDNILRNHEIDNDDDYNDVKNKLMAKNPEIKDDTKSGEDSEGKSKVEEGSARSPRSRRKEDYHYVLFSETRKSLKSGVILPTVASGLDFNKAELLQFMVDPESGIDLWPDPMLLLIKATINWSWYCGQKLLPACGGNSQQEDEEELVAPTTPIPAVVTVKPAPVTPDDDL